MFENRNLRHDLFALGLLALVVFLGVSLITYDPADPVAQVAAELGGWYATDVLVYPQNEQLHNACGRWGALAADVLFQGLGVGAWYVLLSLAVVDITLLRRQAIENPVVRTLGWLASLAGITTLAALLAPHISPGPVIGAGGYCGALCGGLIQAHFALAGGLILCLSVLLGGLLLSTDYWLLLISARILALATRVPGRAGWQLPRSRRS
ncbi:MAG: DNA translocase FtsK 4TM domain-containing protein, partial [Pirellulaceae bacterium]|nr:DNA translocase FtsK 4TM domain-containing protein [Pirellulaceae bacterium]